MLQVEQQTVSYINDTSSRLYDFKQEWLRLFEKPNVLF